MKLNEICIIRIYQMTHIYEHQDDYTSKLSPIVAINDQIENLAGEHIDRVLQSDYETNEPYLFSSQ